MAIADFTVALCVLLVTLLVPFAAFYQILRLKRRAIRISVRPTTRGDQL